MTYSTPLVSISVVTYNHKDYIEQCLEGILMQETTFPYEILLGEDESNDGTREICKQYATKYPDKIRLFLRSRKDVIYINSQPTGRHNFIQNIKAAKGKYIALCEGDDFWTNPLKLQKQVDFLQKHPNINICFHRSDVLCEQKLALNKIPEVYKNKPFNYIELLKTNNFITTASVLFRKDAKMTFPDWYYKIPFGDISLYKLVSNDKKLYCIDQVMSVYRVHDKGLYSGLNTIEAKKNYINFYKDIIPFLNKEEQGVAKEKCKKLKQEVLKHKLYNLPFVNKIYRSILFFDKKK